MRLLRIKPIIVTETRENSLYIYFTKRLFMPVSNKDNHKNPASIWREIKKIVSERTFSELLQDILKDGFPLSRRLVDLYFDKRLDRKYNVDTCGSLHLYELTLIDSKNEKSGSIYDPVPVKMLKYLLSCITKDLSQYTLIDFGSGKKRVLLTASEYNFLNIIGVEFAIELHEVALRTQ